MRCSPQLLITAAFLLAGCGGGPEVVVYTALDEMYSRPLLEAFTQETGIAVKAVYDSEAQKTTGLVTRIIAERGRPRADVFWNNEVAQTIVLKDKGALEAYVSPAAEHIPEEFKDPEGYWAGFAARGRVIIYNTELTDAPPRNLKDFLDPRWKGKLAIALPLFGTTATHAAALRAAWGEAESDAFFDGLAANDVAILAGNATVRDFVALGEYAAGLTDTDDANGAIEDGKPVGWHFPDQDGEGTLLLPNTVALIRGAPNPEAGRKLIDYLLSDEVEARLAAMRSIQIPLKPGVAAPDNVPRLEEIRRMDVRFEDIARVMERTAEDMRARFQR